MEAKTLESLVPPPELCKQIPAGKFADSALVWAQKMHHKSEKHHHWVPVGVPVVRLRADIATSIEWDIIASAPTLQEIMKDFQTCICRHVGQVWTVADVLNNGTMDFNPAEAALRLWLRAEASSNGS